jgi:hypothetical protein
MPYAVFRDADGYCTSGGAYLKEEVEERALEMTKADADQLACWVRYRDEADNEKTRAHWATHLAHVEAGGTAWRTYSAKPVAGWFGHRTAHPAYMSRRRALLGGGL